MKWKIVYTKQAKKDAKKLSACGLKNKAELLLNLIAENPYTSTPPYEKLIGDLTGTYSRRINIQHRLVYEVIESEKTIKIITMYSHYE